MLRYSTIQLLRFHFSFFLLPVFLFAWSEAVTIDYRNLILAFIILHLLIYPASNGYNSYMDRDETPIGGLRQPMQPTKQLFYASLVMDSLAVLLSLLISPVFMLGSLLYILASRAYSYRGIRIKQYPIAGFLTVFIFQGALIFWISYHAFTNDSASWLPCLIASLLIGALYPLTQVYQHEADRKDGVTTISYLLGKRGSFLFSMTLFLLATLFLWLHYQNKSRIEFFYRYLIIMLPVVLFFMYWMISVWKQEAAADFKRSFFMNAIATICTSAFFITLIILQL